MIQKKRNILVHQRSLVVILKKVMNSRRVSNGSDLLMVTKKVAETDLLTSSTYPRWKDTSIRTILEPSLCVKNGKSSLRNGLQSSVNINAISKTLKFPNEAAQAVASARNESSRWKLLTPYPPNREADEVEAEAPSVEEAHLTIGSITAHYISNKMRQMLRFKREVVIEELMTATNTYVI